MNIARLEDRLVLISEPVGVSVYDFDFDLNFTASHPSFFEGRETCVLRIGAIADYQAQYDEKAEWGLKLVNSPEEHQRASQLEHWYPVFADLTPRSEVFDVLPTSNEIETRFDWPIFMKGSRQTSKHNAALSVIRSREDYERAAVAYRADPILHWQRPVIREFLALAPVPGDMAGKIGPFAEFRSFWWFGECVGWGRYFYQVPEYAYADEAVGRALASEAAKRLGVPFLVVDVAKTEDGRWIIIECNDGQESGYAAIPPRRLWRDILDRTD